MVKKKIFFLYIWANTPSKKPLKLVTPLFVEVINKWLLTIIKWVEGVRWDCFIKVVFIRKIIAEI